jgi:hypothetical protein
MRSGSAVIGAVPRDGASPRSIDLARPVTWPVLGFCTTIDDAVTEAIVPEAADRPCGAEGDPEVDDGVVAPLELHAPSTRAAAPKTPNAAHWVGRMPV